MKEHDLKIILGQASIEKNGVASREAWEFLDRLNALPTPGEKVRFIDHAFNELVLAVISAKRKARE